MHGHHRSLSEQYILDNARARRGGHRKEHPTRGNWSDLLQCARTHPPWAHEVLPAAYGRRRRRGQGERPVRAQEQEARGTAGHRVFAVMRHPRRAQTTSGGGGSETQYLSGLCCKVFIVPRSSGSTLAVYGRSNDAYAAAFGCGRGGPIY
jgi:hypothetical protein